MMAAQHTPGPWIARKTPYEGHASGAWYICAPNGQDARSPCVAHVKRSTVQPMEANARLIATAPELLSFAQDISNSAILLPESVRRELRALIAKATGGAR